MRIFAMMGVGAAYALLQVAACSDAADVVEADASVCMCTSADANVRLACGESTCAGDTTYSCSGGGSLTSTAGCGDSGKVDSSADDACVRETQAVPILAGVRASSLAVAGSDLYYLSDETPAGKVSIQKAPIAGGAPAKIADLLEADAPRLSLMVVGDQMYYTDRFNASRTQVDALFSMPLTVKSAQALFQFAGSVPPLVGPSIGVDAARAYVPYGDGEGVRIAPLNGDPTSAFPGSIKNGQKSPLLATDPSGYIAIYQVSNDKKINVYDPSKAYSLVGSATVQTSVSTTAPGKLAISGKTLVWIEGAGNAAALKVCALPTCVPAGVSFASKMSGSAFALANGNVYFDLAVTDRCGKPSGSLASCSLDSLVAGNCAPKVHAIDSRLLSLRELAVGTTTALVSSQDRSVYKIAL